MLEPAPVCPRYEHAAPCDLLHIGIKKFARIARPGHRITGNPQDETRDAGWEFLYVAIEDHSRIAFTAMLHNEKAISSSSFLRQTVAYFQRFGIEVWRVMTDNSPCFYVHRFAHACRDLGIIHKRTHIYTPRAPTARFIQTAIRAAYVRLYQNSADRLDHLQPWIHLYD
jgi:transposase InsO family protein